VGAATSSESTRRILVVGASGVIGRAAFAHFAADPKSEAFGLSRRSPRIEGGTHISVDLLDRDLCLEAIRQLPPITHVVYCALREDPGLIPGWFDPALMETNRRMLENILDALGSAHPPEHLSLLQGTKAYGAHQGTMRVPGRERAQRHSHDNFYWLQEDLLRDRAARSGFGFTIWRPPVVFGHAIGAPMNPIAAIATYAAVQKAEGKPLAWPGGRTGPIDGVDARLLARAFDWATRAESARDEVFNISNGDVFVWENVWESIARAMDMEMDSGPSSVDNQRLQDIMPPKASLWDELVASNSLRAPALMEFVGDSYVYVDMLFNTGRVERPPPSMLSTIKLRQAGFAECIDSEAMFAEWIDWLRRERFLPPL
jgi:nucleoside-diphosphate-sugar epimerase